MDFSLSALPPGDPGIFQTVAKIKQAIYFSLRDPDQVIRKRAESIIRQFGPGERDDRAEVRAVAQFVKLHFHYVHDPRGLEYVKSPEFIDNEITKYHEFIGDCDDASGYLAALLKSIGYQPALVVMTDARSDDPQQAFTHIYVEVWIPKLNKWVPLDMTAKYRPLGWSAPATRLRRYEV